MGGLKGALQGGGESHSRSAKIAQDQAAAEQKLKQVLQMFELY